MTFDDITYFCPSQRERDLSYKVELFVKKLCASLRLNYFYHWFCQDTTKNAFFNYPMTTKYGGCGSKFYVK